MKKLFCIASLAMLVSILLPMHSVAQVTIGANTQPAPYSILEVVSTTAAPGGMRIPQVVTLAERDAIQALLTADLTTNGNGLTIYYLPNQEQQYWNGSNWVSLVTGAANGLTKNGTNIELGGLLTQDTNIDADGNSITFNVNSAVGSNFNIQGLNSVLGGLSLGVNLTTGQVGTIIAPAPAVFFAQSGTETPIPNSINTPATSQFTVPWTLGDIKIDNTQLLQYNSLDQSFTVMSTQSFNGEVSGMMGFIPSAGNNMGLPTNDNTSVVIANLNIQYQRNNDGVWRDLSSVRTIYTYAMLPYRTTMNIPPAIFTFNPGDKIRMVIVRPGSLGINWQASGVGAGIVVPYGSQFSKMLKLVVY